MGTDLDSCGTSVEESLEEIGHVARDTERGQFLEETVVPDSFKRPFNV